MAFTEFPGYVWVFGSEFGHVLQVHWYPPTVLIPAQLPGSDTGGCGFVSGDTSLQMQEDPLHPWFLPDSSGCRHSVTGCTVLLQSLDVLFLSTRHEMLAGMSLLSLLSQSRFAQVLAPNHSLDVETTKHHHYVVFTITL